MNAKTCRVCGETLSTDKFYKANGAKDGLRGECIPCAQQIRKRYYERNKGAAIERAKNWQDRNRAKHLAYQAEYRSRPETKRKMRDLYYRRTFGLTADEVDAMLEAQGGRCAICGSTPDRAASLHVDHDHSTGVVRGILCLNCNQGIGKFSDDASLLRRAAEYLGGTL